VESEKAPIKVIGRYAIYGSIASGGMAAVHYGRLLGPVGFSRTVAIKRLHAHFASDPEFVSMFLDEARLAARIRHPHVVPTLDVVATDGELFLVMEYVPGETLSRLVRAAGSREQAIPPAVAVAIMSGVLQGLHAAHEARNERGEPLGIVHRDVSPQNILVGGDGQSRVLDFGVAKAAGRMQTTRDGQLKGKLSYMAPEQLGGKTLDRRSDVYSAAVVLWETLTGERLFAAENEGATIARVLEGNAPPPSRVLAKQGRLPKELTPAALGKLDKVVAQGLAIEPADRFATAREMALALEECIQPATAAQVSQWIEQIASSVLALRAEQVAEIESSSSASIAVSDVAVELAQKSSPTASDDVPTVQIASNPSNPLPEPPSQVSSVSALSDVTPAPRSESNRRFGVMLGAAMVVLLVGGVWVFRRAPAAEAAATASAAPPPEPSSALPASPSAPAVESAAAPPSAEPAPTPSASASAAASAPVARPARPAVRLPVAKPNKACDPPYTWDAEGRKHYKPECL